MMRNVKNTIGILQYSSAGLSFSTHRHRLRPLRKRQCRSAWRRRPPDGHRYGGVHGPFRGFRSGRSPAAGQRHLESVHFTEGSLVRIRDLLFIIDPRTYQANVDETAGATEVARTRADLARSELNRGQELRQGGNIAASTLQERQQAFLEAQANIQAAQAASTWPSST